MLSIEVHQFSSGPLPRWPRDDWRPDEGQFLVYTKLAELLCKETALDKPQFWPKIFGLSQRTSSNLHFQWRVLTDRGVFWTVLKVQQVL